MSILNLEQVFQKDLLVDALFINDSGGKILLDYLIKELEKTNKTILYLLDDRIEKKMPILENTSNQIIYKQASLINRLLFYKKNSIQFKKIFCFGDFPPLINSRAQTYTYFHQQLYLKTPKDLSLSLKFLIFLKKVILQNVIQNTDNWIVQTDIIKESFCKKFSIKNKNVLVLPFYPVIRKVEKVKREKNSFVYISNAVPHKNHKRLIKAFCRFYEQNNCGKLIITVSEEFTELWNLIQEKTASGYPIENIGFVDRNLLGKIYQSCEFLIFPSLAESFGLGLVEAIENGCKVIGADLPYTFAVCKPSLTFDPVNIASIQHAFTFATSSETKISVSLVESKIDDLIKLL